MDMEKGEMDDSLSLVDVCCTDRRGRGVRFCVSRSVIHCIGEGAEGMWNAVIKVADIATAARVSPWKGKTSTAAKAALLSPSCLPCSAFISHSTL